MKYRNKSGYVAQDKTQKRLDTKIRVLAKQLLINQWFTTFNLLASILLALKIYGFGG